MVDESPLRLALALPGFVAPRVRQYEPAGLFYECRLLRDKLTLGEDVGSVLSASALASVLAARSGDSSEEQSRSASPDADAAGNWLDPDDAKYEKYLENLDPSECNSQDHYKVLGLSKLRWQATESQIRTAYRQKVLRHHPDKRRHRGMIVKNQEEDYFTCITKAYEQLGVSEQKRRAYDSIDPTFDDSVPTAAALTPENFYNVLRPVFERNARWSTDPHVPAFGDENSTKEEVDDLYSFWFDFKSWREFSYLDEEDKEKGEDRWERREIEKINKAEREKRRKKEVKRIRTLVEIAYAADPRVVKFRQAEKDKKDEEKKAKKDAQRAKKEAEERAKREAEEAERARIQAEEEVEKQKREEEKKVKEAQKKNLQKERRRLKQLVQEHNYFTDSPAEQLSRTEDVLKMCEVFSIEKLKELNDHLQSPNGVSAADCFAQHVAEVHQLLEARSAELLESSKTNKSENSGFALSNWSTDESRVLIKAVTMFPPGTLSRWQVIANYVNEHRKDTSAKPKTERDVIKQVKAIQQMEASAKEKITAGGGQNKLGGGVMLEQTAAVTNGGTERSTEGDKEKEKTATTWSADEQKLFEQALKTYNTNTPDRWDKIAECVPGKTKKDCMRRFKELAELVKAKKAAQDKAAGK